MAEAMIQALSHNIEKLSCSIASNAINDIVPPFDGQSSSYKDWIKAINKYSLLNNADDHEKLRILYKTSRGAVSDFILRFNAETPAAEQTFENLEIRLKQTFSQCLDQDQAHKLLRSIGQRKNESIFLFAERLRAVGQDAFPKMGKLSADATQLIEQQLIAYFVDGLADDRIKYTLLKDNPPTLAQAILLAIKEERINKKFSPTINNDDRDNYKNHYSAREEPMDVAHARRKRYDSRQHPANIREVVRRAPVKRCFHCNSPYHLIRNCNLRKQLHQSKRLN